MRARQIGGVALDEPKQREIVAQFSGAIYADGHDLSQASLAEFMAVIADPGKISARLAVVSDSFVAWGKGSIDYSTLRTADGLASHVTLTTGNGATLLPGIATTEAAPSCGSVVQWRHVRRLLVTSSLSFRVAADYMYSWSGLSRLNEENYDIEQLLIDDGALDGVDITEDIVCYSLAIRAFAKTWGQWVSVFASCSAFGHLADDGELFRSASQLDLFAGKWSFDRSFVDVCLTYVQQRVLLPPDVWTEQLYEAMTPAARTLGQFIKNVAASDTDSHPGTLSHAAEYAAGPGYALRVKAFLPAHDRSIKTSETLLTDVWTTTGFKHTLVGCGLGYYGKRCGFTYRVDLVPMRRVDWKERMIYQPGPVANYRELARVPNTKVKVSLGIVFAFEQVFGSATWAQRKYDFNVMEHFTRFIKIDEGKKEILLADFPSAERA